MILCLKRLKLLARLAPVGRENPTPVLLVQHAFVDGIWPMGAEGRHTRIRLRQGSDTLFASSFGIAPQAFAYPVGSEVEAALEVSIFNGRSGPMVSAHLKAIRPAELGNTPSEQAAWFEAFRTGGSLDAARAAALLPARADTVSLYRRIRGGHVAAADLQPVFAAEGPQNTGKTLASLTALQELGLIEEQEGRWLAMHHPFTLPKAEDLDKVESDPGACHAVAYDIVLNGVEMGGGSMRINDPALQDRMFHALGFTEEKARESFGFLMDAYKFGAPPHGGMAYGLDRMVMLMLKKDSIRDVIAFPKVQNAGEPMSGAPDVVDEQQLKDLSIALTLKD